jgi:hypothetical protein
MRLRAALFPFVIFVALLLPAVSTYAQTAAEQAAAYTRAEEALNAAKRTTEQLRTLVGQQQDSYDAAVAANDPLAQVTARTGLTNAQRALAQAEARQQQAQATLNALPPLPATPAPPAPPPPNTVKPPPPPPATPDPASPTSSNTTDTFNPDKDGQWYETCFACVLFEAIDDARTKFAPKAFEVVAGSLSPLLMIFMALYLLVLGAQLILPFGPMERPREIFNRIVVRICMALAVLTLVANYQFFWKVHETIDSVGIRSVHAFIKAGIEATDLRGIDASCQNPPKLKGGADFDAASELSCVMEQMQKMLGIGMRVGQALIKPYHDKTVTANFSQRNNAQTGLETASNWFSGWVLTILYGIIALMVPFRLFDVIIKWTIITVFSPAFVAAFLFPQTRQVSMNALKGLLQSAFTLAIVGIVVATGAVLISYTLANGGDGNGLTAQQLAQQGLDNALVNPVFWQLGAIGILINALLGASAGMAESMIGVAGKVHMPKPGQGVLNKLFAGGLNLIALGAGGTANLGWNRRMKRNAGTRTTIAQNVSATRAMRKASQ